MPLETNVSRLSNTQKGGFIGLAITAAVAAAIPLTQDHEGYRGKAYLDPVKVLTQCYGETRDIDPSRIYSKDECAAKLRTRLAKDYAPVLATCMPILVGADYKRYTNVFGALLDASYNAGPERVCLRFAPVVNIGKPWAVCDSMPGWFTTAKDRRTGVRKVYPGLVRRRKEERALCLRAPT